MLRHTDLSDATVRSMIRKKEIGFGGNKKLKIYGYLNCRSGQRMKRDNRVFFSSEEEARQNNYRPCGHCMKEKYKQWTCSIKP